VRLDPADIEAIAQRVAELLGASGRGAMRYVDAAHVAQVLGVEREWVYAHSHQLGALRLGGPHGRLRFDLEHVQRTLAHEAAPDIRQPPPDRPRKGRVDAADRLELLPYQS
jgi:hypothetical protein